ncbi:hypothetical protein, partial [Streptomyces sp. SID339]
MPATIARPGRSSRAGTDGGARGPGRRACGTGALGNPHTESPASTELIEVAARDAQHASGPHRRHVDAGQRRTPARQHEFAPARREPHARPTRGRHSPPARSDAVRAT